MYIVKNTDWNKNTTSLEKFAIERIIQRCGFTENITNKHRTSNGYTLLKDLIQYCRLTHKRSRTVRTLMTTLEEAQCEYVRQNIFSDIIIDKYFSDLKKFVLDFDSKKLLADKNQPNLTILQNLEHKLCIYEKQLDDHYFDCLKSEFLSIDYADINKATRNTTLLSQLIDILIPFLIFKGYSQATLSEILISWLRSGYHITVSKFLTFLHFNSRSFAFLQYVGDDSDETREFIKLMKDELKIEVRTLEGELIMEEFRKTYSLPSNGLYAYYSYETIDPHKHVRDTFDFLLKRIVAHKERQSLAVFNDFFQHSFWNNHSTQSHLKFKKIKLSGDPINVSARGKTLRQTLFQMSNQFDFKFSENQNIDIPDNPSLTNAIYYYNLALGSKSIENSLSLLWTSLESIQPFKVYSSDIEAIQDFVARSLSIGSISRDLHSFALRVKEVNRQCNYSLKIDYPDLSRSFTDKQMIDWYNWITTNNELEKVFSKIKKKSELLAYQTFHLAKPLKESNQDFILERVNRSYFSIKYQLQRIYLHRNQIVHSGDMVNEYTNLWSHLEWYVGKLLAYYVAEINGGQYKNGTDIFMQLKSDGDYLISYLEKNKDKKIIELPNRIVNLLFKHSWQAH